MNVQPSNPVAIQLEHIGEGNGQRAVVMARIGHFATDHKGTRFAPDMFGVDLMGHGFDRGKEPFLTFADCRDAHQCGRVAKDNLCIVTEQRGKAVHVERVQQIKGFPHLFIADGAILGQVQTFGVCGKTRWPAWSLRWQLSEGRIWAS